jgi:glutathione-regulated potassium-efflux system ancillary protein KefG
MPNRKILLLLFHPRFEDSKANKVLLSALENTEGVTIRDVYELYPDFNIDVKTEQYCLSQNDIIIWQHPFYWYSAPPLMKQWLDLVLEYGWAYGKNGEALKDKYFLSALSSGGTFDVYQRDGKNNFTYRDLLSPFEQTVNLCHGIYLPPFIVPGAPRLNDAELKSYGDLYRTFIVLLQFTNLDYGFLKSINYINDLKLEEWKARFYKTP